MVGKPGCELPAIEVGTVVGDCEFDIAHFAMSANYRMVGWSLSTSRGRINDECRGLKPPIYFCRLCFAGLEVSSPYWSRGGPRKQAGMPVLLKADSFYGFGWLAKKASIVSVALICGVRRSPGQEWWPPWMA